LEASGDGWIIEACAGETFDAVETAFSLEAAPLLSMERVLLLTGEQVYWTTSADELDGELSTGDAADSSAHVSLEMSLNPLTGSGSARWLIEYSNADWQEASAAGWALD
jgi:hypothetical protein